MKSVTIPKLINSITDVQEFLEFVTKFNIKYHDDLVIASQEIKDSIKNILTLEAYKEKGEFKLDVPEWLKNIPIPSYNPNPYYTPTPWFGVYPPRTGTELTWSSSCSNCGHVDSNKKPNKASNKIDGNLYVTGDVITGAPEQKTNKKVESSIFEKIDHRGLNVVPSIYKP